MSAQIVERIEFKVSGNCKGASENVEKKVQVEFFVSPKSIHICEGCFTCLDFAETMECKSNNELDYSYFSDWEKILRKTSDNEGQGMKIKLTLTTSGAKSIISKRQELRLNLESALLKDILTSIYMQGYGYAYLTMKICNPQSHQESEKYLSAVRCTRFDQESNKMQISAFEASACCNGVMELPETWKCWLEPAQGADRFYFANVLIKVDVRQSEPSVFSMSDIVEINKLLEGQVETDLEILAANMTTVKCHRVILMEQSKVFQRMLKTDSGGSQSNQIKMEDMSEEGLKALLRFLYYRDMSKAHKKTCIALELLKFSTKYSISPLEMAVKNILFSKPNDWYEVNATIELFVYANKRDSHYDLKIKSIKVLHERSCEMVSSTVYNQLFREKPETAKELVDTMLSFKPLD